jgi:hypothetical protein
MIEDRVPARDLVDRIDPEVSRIRGLITITASRNEIVGWVSAPSEVQEVRRELLERGVPNDMLQLKVVGQALIPYPVTDERLRRWIEAGETSGLLEAEVALRGPKLRMTPRSIAKAIALGAVVVVVGWFFLSILWFVVLLILES